MRMYPSKMKMLGFTMIGSDRVHVAVEEAIPVPIHRRVGEAFGFDQEFFPLGCSKGSQS